MKTNKTRNNQVQFNSARMMKRKPSDELSSFGEYSELMQNGKEFLAYLSIEIVNQLRGAADPESNWFPQQIFGEECYFCFIGGDSTCSAVIGSEGSDNVKLSSSLSIQRASLSEMLSSCIYQGEGERMMLHAIFLLSKETIKRSYEKKISRIDVVYEMRTDDTDRVASMSMILVNALDRFLESKRLKANISLMLRGQNKTASTILTLKKFNNGLNMDLDLSPKSSGWIFHLDMVALYYRLEQSKKLNHIKVKDRAISATTGKCICHIDTTRVWLPY